MTQVFTYISISLDGFVAGPNPSLENPLGEGGEKLHEWAFRLASFREQHGMGGGGARDEDDDFLRAAVEATGAVVMGRRMFSGGEGPWKDDPNAGGWWGGDPPFRVPVFVLTHHAREPLAFENGTSFTFVTDGIEPALQQARAAAGGKDVTIGGGASVVQQALKAGQLDELRLHVAPILLGSGTHLFEPLGIEPLELEPAGAESSPYVTRLTFRRGGTS
jgi:dihydrofolate reductase